LVAQLSVTICCFFMVLYIVPMGNCHSYASCGQSFYITTFHVDPIELDGPYCSQEK
jgi:hypothetical protein